MRPLRGHDHAPLGHDVLELERVLVQKEHVSVGPDLDHALVGELENPRRVPRHERQDLFERPLVLEVHLPQKREERLGVGGSVLRQLALLVIGRQGAIRVRRDRDALEGHAEGFEALERELRLDRADREVDVAAFLDPRRAVVDELLTPLHVCRKERRDRYLGPSHHLAEGPEEALPLAHMAVHEACLARKHPPHARVHRGLDDGVDVGLRPTVV
mmetsp:Transcript_38394/g.94370  ORF Transcript_38394/g.94370 Transcript_38394/m.94370 type:complete len:215 (-) Transcript_38394:2401-3045(-)